MRALLSLRNTFKGVYGISSTINFYHRSPHKIYHSATDPLLDNSFNNYRQTPKLVQSKDHSHFDLTKMQVVKKSTDSPDQHVFFSYSIFKTLIHGDLSSKICNKVITYLNLYSSTPYKNSTFLDFNRLKTLK